MHDDPTRMMGQPEQPGGGRPHGNLRLLVAGLIAVIVGLAIAIVVIASDSGSEGTTVTVPTSAETTTPTAPTSTESTPTETTTAPETGEETTTSPPTTPEEEEETGSGGIPAE
jgi:cytoskeletal protein RodZ